VPLIEWQPKREGRPDRRFRARASGQFEAVATVVYAQGVKTLVAFDLDGVLYSAEPFLGEAYREAIARVNGRRPGAFPRVPSTTEIIAHVGWPVPVILSRLFPSVDDEAMALIYAETLDVICAHVRRLEGLVFPDVAATLRRLSDAGCLLAVASNGRRRYVEAVLETHDLASHFVPRLSVDGGQAPATKGDLLRTYMQRYNAGPARTVMVGDRESDVEAAAAVGCLFVGCDYGHGHRAEIEAAGPVLSSLAELPRVVRALITGGNR
jgi:phosphoglycolate phosphatase-like HAD superfamily hydrolase